MQLVKADEIDFNLYMLPEEKGEKVKPASFWTEAMLQRLYGETSNQGALLPWVKTHELIAFRPGEVTLWPGINGHKKSMVTGQALLGFIANGQRGCIASLEMKPDRTLDRMAKQAHGNKPAIAYARRFAAWTDGRLWMYDQLGQMDWQRMVAVVRYCAEKLKVDHFVIDSLMKCVKGEDDYNGQKEFVDSLCAVAKDKNIHVHLVHHARKQQNEDSPPNKFDAKGSGSITDQVDNVITVWANKKKDAQRAQGKPVDEMEPDGLLIVDKQRNGEWEGRIALWFDAPSLSYMGERGRPPLALELRESEAA